MEIEATLKCEECGRVWNISKDIRDIDEDEDLRCCGKEATIVKAFRGGEDQESPTDEV